jgi:hypothetical protein
VSVNLFGSLGDGKFHEMLTGNNIDPAHRTRLMLGAVGFLFEFVVQFVSHFQYDWQYLRACQVIDPKHATTTGLQESAEEWNARWRVILDEVPFLGRLPEDTKLKMSTQMQRVRVKGTRLTGSSSGMPPWIGHPKHKKDSEEGRDAAKVLPPDPQQNMILYWSQMKRASLVDVSYWCDLCLLIARATPTSVACETSFSTHDVVNSSRRRRLKPQHITWLIGGHKWSERLADMNLQGPQYANLVRKIADKVEGGEPDE